MNPIFSTCTPLSVGRFRPTRLHPFQVLFVLLLSALSLRGAPPSQPPPPAAIPLTATPATASLPTSPAYRLSANDIVHIRVYQEEDLETSARIGKNGVIPFPLLGSVQIGGRTVPEASAAIEAALRAYIIRPQIALRIVEYTKRKFTVLGQVNRPGTYDFPDDSALSLLEGIGMAGGYTRIANPSRITVKRIEPQGEQVFRLDGKKMAREKNALRFELRPGDTLEIDESLF
jgi:protein involved in polysaccharide export with SLBB domain